MTHDAADKITKALAAARSSAIYDGEGSMRHDEFVIGGTIWCSGQKWRCTDIGSRSITAIKLDRDDDPSCYNGPPYAVAELVFDEYDIEDCTREPDPDDATSPAVSAGPAGGSP